MSPLLLWALLLGAPARAQTLEEVLAAARAAPADLRLPARNYEDPNRLPLVVSMMERPLEALALASATASAVWADAAPERVAERLAGFIELAPAPAGSPPGPGVDPLARLAAAVAFARREAGASLAGLTPPERREVLAWLRSQVTSELPDPRRLKTGRTWQEADERALELAARADLARLLGAGRDLAGALRALLPALRRWAKDPGSSGERETPSGRVHVGSRGPDRFSRGVPLIVDPGGDDVYDAAATASAPGEARLIVDLGGDDRYAGEGFGSLGSGLLGIGVLLDDSGDDVYAGQDASQGAAALGFGLLWDRQGHDLYRARSFSQGAAAYGTGLLEDEGGGDVYRASYMSQGFGFIRGAGLLLDAVGNDAYSSGYSEPDARGYFESYGKYRQGEVFQSLSQGFGFGARELSGGGVGLLLDGAGNDLYQADYFGQGSSYWYALGLLHDRSGNDVYAARRYAQGAGIHFSVGALLDSGGNDRYASWGVSQGVGHDFALGLLWDGDGADDYVAAWTSQGASNGAGIGILRDQGGRDRYAVDDPAVAYWDELRATAGQGLLLDTGEEPSRFVIEASSRAWSRETGAAGSAQAGELGWGLPVPPPPEAVPEVYRETELKERAFLEARLAWSKGLGERTRLSELLAVASGWGMDAQTPLEAKRALLREPPERLLSRLLEWLTAKGVFTRLTMDEYFASAPAARAALEETARSDPDHRRRARACAALGALRGEAAVPALTGALEDGSWRVRAAAARALGRIQSAAFLERLAALQGLLAARPVSVEALASWCSSGEKTETLYAVSLAAPRREEWAGLAEGLSQENTAAETARNAAKIMAAGGPDLGAALGKRLEASREPRAVAELERRLADEDAEVRRWAVFALGAMRRGAGALAARLADEDLGVREAAARALADLGAQAELSTALRFGAPRTRALATRGLGLLKGRGRRRGLERALKDPYGPARLAALAGLLAGEAAKDWTVPARRLARLKYDPDPWVRGMAVEALARRLR